MKLTPEKRSGFTLIEIVIVLAIAALIMVIVFVAVQGAQRARRDTARKNDANIILTAAQQYMSNNSGSVPTTDFSVAYKTPTKDPDGTTYTSQTPVVASATADATTRLVMGPGTCTGGQVTYSATAKTYAVSIYQENGGAYCVSS